MESSRGRAFRQKGHQGQSQSRSVPGARTLGMREMECVCVRSKVFTAGFTGGLWILASKHIVQTKIVYPGLEPWPSFWKSLKSVSGCQSWRLSSCQWTEKTGFLGRRVTVLIWNVCGDIDGSLMVTTDGICMTKGLGKRRVEWSYSCVQRTSGLWLSLTLYKQRKFCLT